MANAATLAARELAKEEALKKRNTALQRPPYPFYIPTNGRNELLCTMLRTHGLRDCHECKIRVLCRYSVHL